MALTKTGIASKISEQMDLDKKTAAESVEHIIEIIKSALASGEEVMFSGFGKFFVNEKNERKGRNPATGESMMLLSRKVVSFKSSGKLKERMNGE